MITVRAIRLGYYGHKRRREGEEFSIRNESDFSPKWMERLDDETPEREPPKKKKKQADSIPHFKADDSEVI
jgi:hypothetical protein